MSESRRRFVGNSFAFGASNNSEIRSRQKLKEGTASAGQILARLLRRTGLEEKFSKYQFVQYWPQIVGKLIAERAQPEAIRNGVLIVRVESSAWAQELSFQKEVIKSRMNSFLGPENAIRDITFYVQGQDQLAGRRKR